MRASLKVSCLSATFSAFLIANPVFAAWTTTVSASNPLNWYRLDEITGSTAIDYGSEGLDGTYGTGVNAPTRGVSALVGTGVTFDGDRDTIILAGSDLSADWTAEFVVKKDVAAGRSSILLRGIPFAFPSTALKFEQHGAPEQVGYTQFGSRDYVFHPPVEVPVGDFLHLVYVKDASTVKAYVNGELAGTRVAPISLSRYQIGDESGESPFAVLDEVVIYDRALLMPEIASHFLGPSRGDFNNDGVLDVLDIHLLQAEIIAETNNLEFDVLDNGEVGLTDLEVWVTDIKNTWIGDANLDGEFNSTDLVQVFQAGQYEDNIAMNSRWVEGDWNADGDFNTRDLVFAFGRENSYEQGPRVAVNAVPEPSGVWLIVLGVISLIINPKWKRVEMWRRGLA